MKCKKINKVIKCIIIITPLIIGIIGFMPLYNNDIFWSVYAAIKLYHFDTELSDINYIVEIARWIAPLATLTIVASVFSSIGDYFILKYKIKKNECYALYGDSIYLNALENELGKNAIKSNSKLAKKAKNQIIAFDTDEENIAFYNENFENNIDDKQIYIQLNDVVREKLTNDEIHIFNIPENCSRVYWNNHPVFEKMKIIIIGFDEYGQSLLTHGLIQNTFSVDSGIEYHIFGDSGKYFALHHEINQFAKLNEKNPKGDSVFTYNDFWYNYVDLLESADRIILCDSLEINIKIISSIFNKLQVKEIHARFEDTKILNTLFGDEKIRSHSLLNKIITFGAPEDIYTREIIMNNELGKRAIRINTNYFMNYKCTREKCSAKYTFNTCIECTECKNDWKKSSYFIRFSNISQADHIVTKLHLLGLSCDFKENEFNNKINSFEKNKKEMHRLSEIEHIRWNKYHFMNNWKYNEIRDNDKKEHNLLVPYNLLSNENKGKDFDVYKGLNDIINIKNN